MEASGPALITDIILTEDPENAEGPAAKFDELLRKEQQKRARKENEWRLALHYLSNRQWREIRNNKIVKKVDPLEQAHWRERRMSNQILGVYQTLVAKATENQPVPVAVPATSEPSDLRSAALAESLIRYLHDELELDSKIIEAFGYALIGQGFIEVGWDADAREPIHYIVHPWEADEEGDPILLPAGSPDADAIRARAEVEGIEVEEHTIYEGEVAVEVCSPFEVYLLGGKDPKEAFAAIKVKGYSRDYIAQRFGEAKAKALRADAIEEVEIGNGSIQHTDEKTDLIILKQIYVKPTNLYPQGLYMAWAQGKVLKQSDFPYEDGELPFAKFGGIPLPGERFDGSLLFSLIPLQDELNKTISQIAEFKNLTLRPQWIAAAGQLMTKITSEPGAVIQYQPRPGIAPPQPVQPGQLPQYLFTHMEKILDRFNDISGQHEVGFGRNPSNTRSGEQVALLLEGDNSRVGLYIRDMERAISRIYRLMLSRAKQFYTEERTIQIVGSSGILQTKSFKAADLSGVKDIRLERGSLIPRSRAWREDQLYQLMTSGYIDPVEYMIQTKVGSEDIIAEYEANVKKAQRAINAVLTDQEFPPPSEIDDHRVQSKVLNLFLLSQEAEGLDPLQIERLMERYQQHQDFLAQEQKSALASEIRKSVAAQGRVDLPPSAVAAILNDSGIEVDPEQIAGEMIELRQLQSEMKLEEAAVKSELKMQEAEHKAELEEEHAEFAASREEEKAEADLERQVTAADAEALRQAEMREPGLG